MSTVGKGFLGAEAAPQCAQATVKGLAAREGVVFDSQLCFILMQFLASFFQDLKRESCEHGIVTKHRGGKGAKEPPKGALRDEADAPRSRNLFLGAQTKSAPVPDGTGADFGKKRKLCFVLANYGPDFEALRIVQKNLLTT
jgi:hypothetical protein